mgnify:CR=1 FL=1
MYLDTHSHIYLDQFEGDEEAILTRAANVGVDTIMMPAIDSQTHEAMLKLEENTLVRCLSMIGLHPCSVNETVEKELSICENYLQSRKFWAIGETGLDFYWDLTFKTQQYQAFETQIEWSLSYDLPIVIHSRESTDACIEVVSAFRNRGLKGVFHCFGGTLEQANKILETGLYLGIGGVLTFKKSGLEDVVRQVPLDSIILETDAPYLAPVPFRGKRNEPAYIPYISQKLAEVKGTSIEQIAHITTKNAKELFKLAD